MAEVEWIRLLVEVSGVTESRAKCMVIYLDLLQHVYFPRPFSENGLANGQQEFPIRAVPLGMAHRLSADSRQLLSGEQVQDALHPNPALNGHNAG
jgi:hypothetical protein